MSERQEKGDLERAMDAAPDGQKVDAQAVAESITSGQVEAEEQPTPEDEERPGNNYPFKQTDRERPR